MSLLSLLRHQWLARVRTMGHWNAHSAQGALGVLGLVMAGLGAAAGLLLPQQWPTVDLVRRLSAGLLMAGGLYTAVRAYSQAEVDAQPYRSLPVSDARLARLLVGRSLLDEENLTIAMAFVGFWGTAVLPTHGWSPSSVFGLGVMAGLGICTHLTPFVRRVLGDRPFLTATLFGSGALLVASGALPLPEWSTQLFGGLLHLDLTSIVLLGGGYGGSLFLHLWWRRRTLPLDGSQSWNRSASRTQATASATKTAGGSSSARADAASSSTTTDGSQPSSVQHDGEARSELSHRRSWLADSGRLGALVATELRLLRRNRHPRHLGILLVFPIFVAGLAAAGSMSSSSLSYDWTRVLYIAFATGGWVAAYGTALFGWTGRQLEGVLSRGLAPDDLLRAKLTVLVGGAVVFWLLPLPVLLLTWNVMLVLHTTFFVYALGWGVPVVAWVACFDSRPVPLNSSAWSDTSHVGLNTAATAGVFGPLFLPLLWASGWHSYMTIVGAMGLVSAAAGPLWWRLLKRTWHRRRHSMLAAFRESQS